MADKTIGELPALNQMQDEALIPCEYDGAAKALSGSVLSDYIYDKVEDDVEVISAIIATGPQGADGFSPVVSTSKSGGVATVSITDADGIHSFTVNDGDVSMAELTNGNASGPLATFTRLTDGIPVSSLICDINPVQAGSGDPSPSNVRTISGRTEANIYTAGENLFNVNAVTSLTTGTTASVNGSDLTIVANGTSTTYQGVGYGTRNNLIYPAGTYSIKATIVSNSNTAVWSAIGFRTGSNSFASGSTRPLSTTGTFSWTVTITEPCFFSIVVNGTEANRAATVVLRDMIISREETDYTSYIGSTYPISLGRTVYGGKLNVTTGELTVTHGYIASYSGQTLPGKWIADRAVYAAGTTPPTGSQVVYELAEAETYQLSATQIASLLGENNIWADCGDVYVEFGDDINTALSHKADLTADNKVEATQASSKVIWVDSSRTLTANEIGCTLVCTNSPTITIPSAAMGVDGEVEVLNYGTGTVTVTTDGMLNGVTNGEADISVQYKAAVVKALAAGEMVILGEFV